MYVDDVLMCSASGDTNNFGGATLVRFGLAEVVDCGPLVVYGDDFALSDSYIGT